jgi:HlyD family secretion protein
MVQAGNKTEVDFVIHSIRRNRAFKPVAIALAVAMLGACGWFGWQAYTESSKPKIDQRNIAIVKRGSVDIRISSTGTIRPFNQVKLSPKYTGLLRTLNVQQGDHVTAGQIVAVMDDSNLIGQLQAAEGAYQAAKANYEKALHGSRPQELVDSEAQLRKAKSMVQASTMAVNRSRADLTAMEAQLVRDETNAKRLATLAAQGAISDQDRLNASTQAEVTRAQLERVKQELKAAEYNLAQAKSDLESASQKFSMVKEGFRKEDVRAAQQSMMQAAGNLKYMQSQLNDTRIRAPFDGVVTQKYADIGAIVTPTTASATNSATSSSILSLAGRLELVASVSEADIDNIRPGQEVQITASAYPTKTFRGHVTLVAPEAIVTSNVTSFEVHAAIDDDPERKLLSGMNVNAEFIAGKKENVLVIPTVCVASKRGKVGVFVPSKDGAPQFKPIKIGSTSDSQTIVTEGLQEGDKVLVGLTKEQLIEQGYSEKNIFQPGGKGGGGGRPELPRGLRNKL